MRASRLAAWDVMESIPMPDLTQEAWRRTDLRTIDWRAAAPLNAPAPADLSLVPDQLYHPLIGDTQGGLLVFMNGKLVHRVIDPTLEKQGVIFTDITTAIHEHPELVREAMMTRAITPDAGKFAALHGAIWTHGVFLYVPAGRDVELPLHSVEYATGEVTTSTHILAVIGTNASATYLHESASPSVAKNMLHFGATELLLDPAARLRFVRFQNWSENTANIEHQRARLKKDAHLDWVAGEMGTRLNKVFTSLELDEDGAEGRISGMYFPHGSQHIDLDTEQNHHALHNTSDLLYKGALKEKSHAVWRGMIRVDTGAQKTDGYQVNRNMLMDSTARADSIPGLEIKANDVRCTHATATGQVDREMVFYLMSRGISEKEALRIVILGFFEDVLQRIPFDEVKERLLNQIEDRLIGMAA